MTSTVLAAPASTFAAGALEVGGVAGIVVVATAAWVFLLWSFLRGRR